MNKQEVVKQLVAGRSLAPQAAGTAFAPANIALVKYWGKREVELNLPVNSSVSVSLGRHGARTTVTLAEQDEFILNGRPQAPENARARRLFDFLDLFRAAPDMRFHVVSESTVPVGAGLASSASGFAALVRALDALFGWGLDARLLSILARLGSGSAARSLFEGFVQWHAGRQADGMDSFAEPLAACWPEFCIGWLSLATEEKPVSSRAGMIRTADTSPFYSAWPAQAERDMAEVLAAIESSDFPRLGACAEANALAMHATMIAARPPLLYWLPESVAVMQGVWRLRAAGVPVYFTMDAGPNIKLLFLRDQAESLQTDFPGLEIVAPFARP